ncbi:MAG: hypothetical protein LBS86_06820 [Treponema sp.]|jgi:hypothetical protein|nr:hypothetical protein [Treponema sp.]
MKISDEERQEYAQKTIPYQTKIDALWKEEARLLGEVDKDPCLRLTLCETMLNLSSYYFILHGLFVAICKAGNEALLLEERKCIVKSIGYLEDAVTKYVDVPFSDYENNLAAISNAPVEQRYLLAQKLSFSITILSKALGENSRWQWPLVELEGRAAAVTKNLLDLKNAFADMDPRSPAYAPMFQHILLVKRLLKSAADRYRARYEIVTNQINDFRVAINFLYALRRIHIFLGEPDEAESLKRMIDGWNTKFDVDSKTRK